MNSLFLKLALWEKDLFFLLNKSIKNKLCDIFFPLITRLAEDAVLLAICAIVFLLGKRKAKVTSMLAVTAIALSRLSVQILKHIFNRPRPFFVYKDINIFTAIRGSSFPSGHATLIFSVATVLSFKYKRISWIFITFAILIGLSRVYMGLHYPSDIISGAVLGISIGMCILYLENKLSVVKKI